METFKEILVLIGFHQYLQPSVSIFAFSLGMVYLFGRMLFMVKTPIGKNRVAAISLGFGTLAVMSSVFIKNEKYLVIIDKLYQFFFLVGIGCILYTLIGMRIFSRINRFQDRIIGEDSEGYDPEGMITTKNKNKLPKSKK
jgi:hypothetical protein